MPLENKHPCPALYRDCFPLIGSPYPLGCGRDGWPIVIFLTLASLWHPWPAAIGLKVAPGWAVICQENSGNSTSTMLQRWPPLFLLLFAPSRSQPPLLSTQGSFCLFPTLNSNLKIHASLWRREATSGLDFVGSLIVFRTLTKTWNCHLCLFVYLFIIC